MCLGTYQIKLENAEDRVRELQQDLEEKSKRILQLETQLIGK